MARDTSHEPSGSSRTKDRTKPKARFRDDGLDTSGEARLLDASLDTEIVALGELIPQSTPGAGFLDNREADPIDLQDATSTHLTN